MNESVRKAKRLLEEAYALLSEVSEEDRLSYYAEEVEQQLDICPQLIKTVLEIADDMLEADDELQVFDLALTIRNKTGFALRDVKAVLAIAEKIREEAEDE